MRKQTATYPFIKLGIVDDHKSYAEALRYSFNISKEFDVAFILNEGSHLLQELYRHQVDILLLDIRMKDEDGFTLMKAVKKVFPSVKIIMISFHTNHAVILQSYQLGASSYFSKSLDLEELKIIIRKVYRNGLHFPENAAFAMYESSMKNVRHQDIISCGISFTDIEKEIILLAAQGYDNKKMAKFLRIKPETLATYRKRLIRKTKCSNITQVVAFAMQHNIVVMS